MSLRNIWTDVKEAGEGWLNDNATRLSAAVAFYTILSIAPLFIIAIAVAGVVFGREAATGALTQELSDLVGNAGAEVVQTAIERANKPREGILASIIGIVTLLYGASGVFGELQGALNTVWEVTPKPGRGIWAIIRDRFLTFSMVVVIGFLLLVSLILTTFLEAFSSYLENLVPGLPVIMRYANFVVSIIIITVLFALVFKILPDAEVSWRDVAFGSLVTAVLFTLGKYLISLYLARGSTTTPFGAAGSLVALLVWVYYSGLILLFGAELTKVTAKHAGRQIQPSKNAVSIHSISVEKGHANT